MSFKVKDASIPDVKIIEKDFFSDERGIFSEVYKLSEFLRAGLNFKVVQINYATSRKNVFRGLHYQLNPKAQSKFVLCIRGKIIDFAVDIRKNSPYYSRYVSVELSEENGFMIYIPKGFAHGYFSIEKSVVLYMLDEEYAPHLERGVRWDDPQISIKLPHTPILSKKDMSLPYLFDAENNFDIK